jgi:glycosyltransferase involved in cell wall biosynthesis
MSGPARILHAPTAVGGHPEGLSAAERELGFHSDVALLGDDPFGYGADISVDLDVSRPRQIARRLAFLRRAVRDYDVFHFNFGRSIAGFNLGKRVVSELPLLKLLGKKILVTFQGCDVRPPTHCYCRIESCAHQAQWRHANAAQIMRNADRVFYCNPDLREWLPGGRFVPYALVDLPSLQQLPPDPERREMVVCHAPTNRNIKGTEYVIEAVEQLRREGVPVRLELLEGLQHDEVIERCGDADVVVDQLLIGWYGTFAAEAMALGKPVLAYIRERSPEDNPFGDELPIVRSDPAQLAARLRELIADPAGRERLGRDGRAFVERHHDPRRVARDVLEGIVELPAEAETPAGR